MVAKGMCVAADSCLQFDFIDVDWQIPLGTSLSYQKTKTDLFYMRNVCCCIYVLPGWNYRITRAETD